MQCVAVCCSVLQCSVLQCVAVRRSALCCCVCCSVLQSVAGCRSAVRRCVCCSVSHCSVLLHVLQCIVVQAFVCVDVYACVHACIWVVVRRRVCELVRLSLSLSLALSPCLPLPLCLPLSLSLILSFGRCSVSLSLPLSLSLSPPLSLFLSLTHILSYLSLGRGSERVRRWWRCRCARACVRMYWCVLCACVYVYVCMCTFADERLPSLPSVVGPQSRVVTLRHLRTLLFFAGTHIGTQTWCQVYEFGHV